MKSVLHFVTVPHACSYLPDREARIEYEQFRTLTAAEYLQRMQEGWRRFGHTLFRPRCQTCMACQSLRVVVEKFRPDRSQRRVRQANEGVVRVQIGKPAATREKLNLYDRYHAFQTAAKNWPLHAPKDADSFADAFVDNPFPTQEWCYYLNERLVGVGYVDDLPGALSAIYFVYDPEKRKRSLGTWNVLSVLDYAAARRIPYVYLGYFVAGCRSMAYKARFLPHQIRDANGCWRDVRHD